MRYPRLPRREHEEKIVRKDGEPLTNQMILDAMEKYIDDVIDGINPMVDNYTGGQEHLDKLYLCMDFIDIMRLRKI